MDEAQRERLTMLIEECAEVQHAATKILRHGYGLWHPVTQEANEIALVRELEDLLTLIREIGREDGVRPDSSDENLDEIWGGKIEWTYHQAESPLRESDSELEDEA